MQRFSPILRASLRLAPICRLASTSAAATPRLHSALLFSGRSALGAARFYSVKTAKSMTTNPEDAALVKVLRSEIEHEERMGKDEVTLKNNEKTPKCLQDLIGEKMFKINQTVGGSEITLVRELKTLGEKVNVTFSIDDVENAEFIDSEDQDGVEIDSNGNPTNMSGDTPDEMRIPVSVVITVTKENSPGALVFQAVAEDGAFNIGNVSYTTEKSTALGVSAEADFQRRGLYMGPSFESLDDGLRESLDQYLAARGVNDDLAEAIPLYVRRKEQEEYRKWLNKVHSFIAA